MTAYLTVADYLLHRAHLRTTPVSGLEWHPDLTAVWAALAAPAAQVGPQTLHEGLLAKAAVQTVLLVTRIDVDPSEDPVALACLQDFLLCNGAIWQRSLGEADDFCLLASEIRAGRLSQAQLAVWISRHVGRDGRRWG